MPRNDSTHDGSALPESPSVHDAVLAVIPLSLLAAALVGVALSASASKALLAGSLPATGTIGYALFYNPPDGDGDG